MKIDVEKALGNQLYKIGSWLPGEEINTFVLPHRNTR